MESLVTHEIRSDAHRETTRVGSHLNNRMCVIYNTTTICCRVVGTFSMWLLPQLSGNRVYNTNSWNLFTQADFLYNFILSIALYVICLLHVLCFLLCIYPHIINTFVLSKFILYASKYGIYINIINMYMVKNVTRLLNNTKHTIITSKQ